MGRDTVFRGLVHFIGPDLYLKGLSPRIDQGRMQGLVHIRLRHGDIILEPPGNRLVHLMDNTKHRVTVPYRLYQNPNCKQIVDLLDRLVLVQHLLINTEEMLDSAVDGKLDPGVFDMSADLLHDPLNVLFPLAFTDRDLIYQVVINLGLQIF